MTREKKYPAEHLGGKKYLAHQVARKILLTRNHPPPPPPPPLQELNGRPLKTSWALIINNPIESLGKTLVKYLEKF